MELLGRGGMGEVWRAFDTRRERFVALKRLNATWARVPEFQQRFEREARVSSRITSEHVGVIHDFGEIDGVPFIDMRLVAGGDLAALLDTAPRGLDTGRAVDLCVQIADALDAAHRMQVIHRDVKPSNVLLAADGAGHRASLVDFGIVKLVDELTDAGLTRTGATLWTPAYMAPELYVGAGHASVASDVYALGCVLFEMLTGRRVFLAATLAGLMTQHLMEPAPRISMIHPELTAFDPVLARALAKEPGERHAAPGELAQDALGALGAVPGSRPVRWPATPVPGSAPVDRSADTLVGSAAPPSARAPGRRPRWWRRRAVLLACASVLAVAVAVSVTVVATRTSSAPSAPLNAERIIGLRSPFGVAFTPDGLRAYVTSATDDNQGVVTALDVGTRVAQTAVYNGAYANDVVVLPGGRRAYVVNTGYSDMPRANSLSVLDTAGTTVTGTVPVGPVPLRAVATPDGRRLYVSNAGEFENPANTVSVVDTTTNAVVATVPVGAGPDRLAMSLDGRRVYVPIYGSSTSAGTTMTVIDTADNTTRSVPVGCAAPVQVLPAPDGRRVYVVCAGPGGVQGSVQVLDDVDRPAVPLGGPIVYSWGAALTPDGRTLIASDSGTMAANGSTVAFIDTATGARRTVTLPGQEYQTAAITPDGSEAWLTSTSSPTGDGAVWRVPLER